MALNWGKSQNPLEGFTDGQTPSLPLILLELGLAGRF